MSSEGSEHSEDEKYWYPAFRLKENPFRYFEASLETDVDAAGPYIKTRMDQKIRALLDAKVSAIVKGPRGCGKSSIVLFAAWSKGKQAIRVATPKNVPDLYDQIFFNIDRATRAESAKTLWGDKLERLIDYKRLGRAIREGSVCALCQKHCPLTPPGFDFERTLIEIGEAPSPCLARKMIAQSAIETWIMGECLLDVPDDADRGDVVDLARICMPMVQNNVVIIFATEGQARMLAGSDVFSRLPVIEFEKPSGEFFTKLFTERINASREGSGPYPFEYGVITRIASLANYNIREFIRICSLVLVEMWLRNMTSPCTLEFLSELNIRPAAPSDRATIAGVLRQHEGQWVGVQALAQEISEALDAQFTERKVGAMVRDLGFDQFKRDAGGRSQVLISPNVLSAIQGPEDTEHSEGSEG